MQFFFDIFRLGSFQKRIFLTAMLEFSCHVFVYPNCRTARFRRKIVQTACSVRKGFDRIPKMKMGELSAPCTQFKTLTYLW